MTDDLERVLDTLEDLAQFTWEGESDMANDARRLIIAHLKEDAERDIEWSARLVEEYEKGYEASRAELDSLREEVGNLKELLDTEKEVTALLTTANGELSRELDRLRAEVAWFDLLAAIAEVEGEK